MCGAGRRAGREAGGGIDCRLGAGRGEERTENMPTMYVTPEVSKLSGWLNADAPCRESKGGHTVRCEVRAWRRETEGDRGARSVQGRARLRIGGRARRGAHVEHVVHVRDAGGVPVGNVRIEIIQAIEDVTHFSDGRDVPLGDGAALRSGGGRVSVEALDRRLQGGLG
eukprot:scaffold10238_cov45-Phaeocystis_antarctica.AAC.3